LSAGFRRGIKTAASKPAVAAERSIKTSFFVYGVYHASADDPRSIEIKVPA
jgi:hypothetical protein